MTQVRASRVLFRMSIGLFSYFAVKLDKLRLAIDKTRMEKFEEYMSDPPKLSDFVKGFAKQCSDVYGPVSLTNSAKYGEIMNADPLTIEHLVSLSQIFDCEISWLLECASDAMTDFALDFDDVSGKAAKELLIPYVCAKKAWSEYTKA